MKVIANSEHEHSTARDDEASTARYAPWSAKNDAEMLHTLSVEFESSVSYCECGRAEPLRDFDCASMLRDYMAQRPVEAESAQHGSDVHASAAPAAAPLPVPECDTDAYCSAVRRCTRADSGDKPKCAVSPWLAAAAPAAPLPVPAELAFKPDWMDFQHGYEAGLAAAPLPQDEPTAQSLVAGRAMFPQVSGFSAPLPQDERAALTKAYAALRNWMILHPNDCDDLDKQAMDAIRAALSAASPAAPIQPMNTDDGHSVVGGLTGSYGEWRPIETAPKDGTDVIVAERDEFDGRWRFAQTYWRKYLPGYGDGFGWIGHKPTHWMPLPLAPGRSADTGQARVECTDSGCSDSIGIAAPAAAVQRCEECGDPVPKRVCYCVEQGRCYHAAAVQSDAERDALLREARWGLANLLLDDSPAASKERQRIIARIDAAMGTAGKEQPQ